MKYIFKNPPEKTYTFEITLNQMEVNALMTVCRYIGGSNEKGQPRKFFTDLAEMIKETVPEFNNQLPLESNSSLYFEDIPKD